MVLKSILAKQITWVIDVWSLCKKNVTEEEKGREEHQLGFEALIKMFIKYLV